VWRWFDQIWSDRDAFLLCYRQYCTPEQLLEKITSLYVFAPQSARTANLQPMTIAPIYH
jgi:hypothetical protein